LLFRKSCVLLLFVLFFATQVAAQTPTPPLPNPHWQAAFDSGIIHQLNSSKTIKGVTVTLNWMYLDETLFRLSYSITGKDEALIRTLGKSRYAALQDSEGVTLPLAVIGTGVASNPDKTFTLLNHAEVSTTLYNSGSFQNYFDQFESLPTKLDLTFEVNRNGVMIPDPTLSPEATSEAAPASTPPTTPGGDVFAFDVSLPVYPAVRLEPEQVITHDDLPITFKSAVITPLFTQLEICYELPDPYDNSWYFIPTLTFDGIEANGISIMGAGGEGCQTYSYLSYYDGTPTTLKFRFDSVRSLYSTVTPAEWEEIQPILEARGVIAELNPPGSTYIYNVISTPEGINFDVAFEDALVEVGLIERYEGPWEFEVEINSQSS
jgi:hypothetical protein